MAGRRATPTTNATMVAGLEVPPTKANVRAVTPLAAGPGASWLHPLPPLIPRERRNTRSWYAEAPALWKEEVREASVDITVGAEG